MRTNRGAIWASIIALFLGCAAVTQVRSQDVYSRSLNLETPSSLTTLIANLSETNNELRNEIFDVRRDVSDAQDSVSSGKGTLTEAQHQVAQLRVFSAQSADAGLLQAKMPMVERFFAASLAFVQRGLLPSGGIIDHAYLWETWEDTPFTPRDMWRSKQVCPSRFPRSL